jgi:hypothetical protein
MNPPCRDDESVFSSLKNAPNQSPAPPSIGSILVGCSAVLIQGVPISSIDTDAIGDGHHVVISPDTEDEMQRSPREAHKIDSEGGAIVLEFPKLLLGG